jgi:hypothetical protein
MSRVQRYLISLEYTLEEFWGVGRWGEYGAYRQMLALYALNVISVAALVRIFTGMDIWSLFPVVAALAIIAWLAIRSAIARARKECPPAEFLREQSRTQMRQRHAAVKIYIIASAIALFGSVWFTAYRWMLINAERAF